MSSNDEFSSRNSLHDRSSKIPSRLFNRLARDSLEYYVILQSESHRDAWTSVLILLFTRLLKLNDERVR